MKNGVIIIRSDGSTAEPASAAIQIIRDGEVVETRDLKTLKFELDVDGAGFGDLRLDVLKS